ncbi:MAG: hypothetical protein ACK5WR_20960, partial [Planctomycetaceae bacterium]
PARRDRGRRRSSRPEDWNDADFESIEDRVGFGAEEPEEADDEESAGPRVDLEDIPSWEEAISYLLKAEPDSGPSRGGPRRGGGGGGGGGRGGRGRPPRDR